MGGRHVVVVGAGGNIGSHLAPHLVRLPGVGRVTLVDRDRYERGNLPFQDMEAGDVGRPKAEVQAERGRFGEERLQRWLDDHQVGYRDEEDLRGAYPKTPDILLDEPMVYNGTKLFWIESKANFGDRTEVSRNTKRQLKPYSELFGPGMVIYWFGVVDGLQGRRNDVFVGTAETLDELEETSDLS